jgi:aminoglycoside 3-N-acetyltransferase
MRGAMIRYRIGRWLPEPVKKRARRWLNKQKTRQRKAAKEAMMAQHGTFDAEELVTVLRKAGLQVGSVLFVHCSFNDLYTFSGTSMDVLIALNTLVGKSGTLLMPAYTTNTLSIQPRLFDAAREPTYTGLVNELFRRSPGVIRSLHPRHSICGLGPLAEDLLSGHEACVRSDGPDSPFDRLRKRDDANILTLGLPPGYISILHWVEDLDPSKLPFRVHADEPITCQVRDMKGRIAVVQDWNTINNVAVRTDYERFSQYLSSSAMRYWAHKGVVLGLYPAKALAEELLVLRDRGIIHYF